MIPYYGEEFETPISHRQAKHLMMKQFGHGRLPRAGHEVIMRQATLKAGSFETPVQLKLMHVCGRYQLASHSVPLSDWREMFNFNPNTMMEVT